MKTAQKRQRNDIDEYAETQNMHAVTVALFSHTVRSDELSRSWVSEVDTDTFVSVDSTLVPCVIFDVDGI